MNPDFLKKQGSSLLFKSPHNNIEIIQHGATSPLRPDTPSEPMVIDSAPKEKKTWERGGGRPKKKKSTARGGGRKKRRKSTRKNVTKRTK